MSRKWAVWNFNVCKDSQSGTMAYLPAINLGDSDTEDQNLIVCKMQSNEAQKTWTTFVRFQKGSIYAHKIQDNSFLLKLTYSFQPNWTPISLLQIINLRLQICRQNVRKFLILHVNQKSTFEPKNKLGQTEEIWTLRGLAVPHDFFKLWPPSINQCFSFPLRVERIQAFELIVDKLNWMKDQTLLSLVWLTYWGKLL